MKISRSQQACDNLTLLTPCSVRDSVHSCILVDLWNMQCFSPYKVSSAKDFNSYSQLLYLYNLNFLIVNFS